MEQLNQQITQQELDFIKLKLVNHETRICSVEERLTTSLQLVNEVKSSVTLLTKEQERLIKLIEYSSSETQKTMEIIKKHIIEEFENQLKQGYRVDRLIKAILFTGISLVITLFALALAFPDIIKFLKPFFSVLKP